MGMEMEMGVMASDSFVIDLLFMLLALKHRF